MLITLSRNEPAPNGFLSVDTTSHSTSNLWRQFSPFLLGPVELYDGLTAQNVENAWQFSKVYVDQIDGHGNPLPTYFSWRDHGFAAKRAYRHPRGRDARPVFSLWKENGQWVHLSYIDARKTIYLPLYIKAVKETDAFAELKTLYDKGVDIALHDFDGYNFRKKNMSIKDVVENPSRPMGHSIAIALALGEPYEAQVEEQLSFDSCIYS